MYTRHTTPGYNITIYAAIEVITLLTLTILICSQKEQEYHGLEKDMAQKMQTLQKAKHL